jgi:lysosomal-associated membrane protein 1/2
VNVPALVFGESDKDGTYTVECSENSTDLNLDWKWNGKKWRVVITWSKTASAYSLSGINATVPRDSAILPHIDDTKYTSLEFTNASLGYFELKLNQSYMCISDETKRVDENLSVRFSDLKFQVFGGFENSGYSAGIVCTNDKKAEKIIPIIVGCVLAGLIVIVIVAYVIATRYKKYHGYETL